MGNPLSSRSGLSIRTRTFIGYGMLVALALLASIMALVHMHFAERSIDTITMGSVRMQNIAEIRMHWDRMMVTLNRMLLTRQSSIVEQELDEAMSSIMNDMQFLRTYRQDAEDGEFFDNLLECMKSAESAVDSIGRAATRGLWATAQIMHHTELASIQRRIEDELTILQESTSRQVEADIKSAEDIKSMIRKGLGVTAVMVLLLGPLAAVLTTSSIVRPIEYLASSVMKLQPDGLQNQLDVSRNDEIGELAEAYNAMTRRLHQALGGLREEIQAHTRAREALQTSESRYRNLFQHSPIGLCELDLSGIMDILADETVAAPDLLMHRQDDILSRLKAIDVNRATLELIEVDDMSSLKDLGEYLTHDGRRAVIEALSVFAAGGVYYSSETEAVTSSGETRNVIAHFAVPPGGEENLSRVFISIQDITESKNVEKALRRSEEQYYHAQKMEAVGRLTGGIAHDFNNLLTVIISNCDIALMNRNMDVQLRNRLEQILGAATRASSVTEQLLAFSHQQVSNPVPVDPGSLVREISRMLSHTMGEEIQLVVELTPDLPAVMVDPVQMEQVVLNLAVNAMDAMPEGGRFRIATSCVTVTEYEHGDDTSPPPGRYVLFLFEDNGSGMEQEVLERAFDPFFTTKERGKGTGLGLASVHGIVTDSGGWIEVDTTPTEGTVFKVYLPATGEPAAPVFGRRPEDALDRGEGTILLVEDEKGVREVVASSLRLHGYRVLTAEESRSALELFNGSEDSIDLLLTDVVLPGKLNGLQIAERMRESRPDLAVLLMSGYAFEAISRNVSLPENTAFISKPFSTSLMLEKISMFIRRDHDSHADPLNCPDPDTT
ncbi:MAG: ATP-binding protein [Candidatus Aegiribacteria sp.]